MIFLFVDYCFPSCYCHHAFSYRIVILSIAKDLITSTLCIQIFRASPQQLVFTTFRMTIVYE